MSNPCECVRPCCAVIPAENLVAAYSATPDSRLMAVAATAKDAEAMFEALETGTDGVVLRTEDPGKGARGTEGKMIGRERTGKKAGGGCD